MVEEPAQRSLERVSPVLVGRDEALAHALRRWEAARLGSGQLLLVSGEAGIGKSRLLAEIANRVAGSAPIVDAGAFPRDAEAAGALILAISDGLHRVGLAGPAALLRDRLLHTDRTGDPARRRRVLVGDLTETMLAVAEGGPILFRLEDLHWADDISLEVLERVASGLAGRPALVLASYRSDELVPHTPPGAWRARLLERRAAEEVRLQRLDAHGTAAIVEAITGVVPSTDYLASLQSRSDGIPLHVEELIAGGATAAVPDTVAEAVGSRAAALDSGTRAILEAGSVVGRTFDLDLLGATAQQPAESVDTALTILVDSHLVVPVGDDGIFVFRHALICDAVYAGIAPNRRRSLHGSVATAAERAGLGDAYISEHFERAGDAASAHRHALAGAAEAVRVSAHREAAELYRRAQRTAPQDVDGPARAALHAALAVELAAIDDNESAERCLVEAIDLYRLEGDERAAALLVAPLMAARHLLGVGLEERSKLASVALERIEGVADVSPVRAELLGALAAAHMLDRRLEEATEFGRQAAALATGPTALTLRIDIDLTLGSVLVFAGRGAEGWALLESAIAASAAAGLEAETARGYRMVGTSASVLVEYDRAEKWIAAGLDQTARTERWNDYHYLAAHLGHVQWATGESREAELGARHALADARGITTRITALIVCGYLALGRAELDSARALLTEALEQGERMGELQRFSPALWGLAEVALAEEDPALAVRFCERGFEASEQVADAAYLFPFVVTGVRAFLDLHEPRLARELLRRGERLLLARGIPGTLPALDHARGLIHLAEGQTGSARALLESAAAGWTERRRRWEGDRVLVDLARCAIRSKRPAEASRLLAEARRRADATGSLLLASLADAVGLRPGADAGPLSAREFEVARLVASGSTNREIATALTISPKTASSHIEHILAKLGYSRRAEIAAWVTRHG
ncbi:helix-turn-helix transcriptional regulator [Lacisediminihabitans sp.]|jgi:DNA-binding CsgD family transcriptional regulator|uniref:helix-turn-helix transcriptional regulator n=1 Tax=Lacisediminihabitans sp. TaxID=2787631 RepID=UPI002F935DA9